MTRRRIGLLVVGTVMLSALACGGGPSATSCKPGDTRASKGHTDVCNKNGKWTPYVQPTVPR